MQLPLFALSEDMQMKMFKTNPMGPVSVRADHRVMLYAELTAAWESTTLDALATASAVVPDAEKYAAVQSQSLPTPSDSTPSLSSWNSLPAGLAQALSEVMSPGTAKTSDSGEVSVDSPDELVRHTRAAMNALCEISASDWSSRHDMDLRVIVAAWSAAADRGLPLDRLMVGWMPAEEVGVMALGVRALSDAAIRTSITKASSLARSSFLGPWYRVAARASLRALRAPLYAMGWALRRFGVGVLFLAVGLERLGGAPAKAETHSSSEEEDGPRIVMVSIRRAREEDDE